MLPGISEIHVMGSRTRPRRDASPAKKTGRVGGYLEVPPSPKSPPPPTPNEEKVDAGGIRALQQKMMESRMLLDSHNIAMNDLRTRVNMLHSSLVARHTLEAELSSTSSESRARHSPEHAKSMSFLGHSPRHAEAYYPPPLMSRMSYSSALGGSANSDGMMPSRNANDLCYKNLAVALRGSPEVLGPALGVAFGIQEQRRAKAESTARGIIQEICGYRPNAADPCTQGQLAAFRLISRIPAPLPVITGERSSGDPGEIDECRDSLEAAVVREFCRECGRRYLKVTLGPLVETLARKSNLTEQRASTPSRHLLPYLSRLLQSLLRSLPGIPDGIKRLGIFAQESREPHRDFPREPSDAKSGESRGSGGGDRKNGDSSSAHPPRGTPVILVHSATLRRKSTRNLSDSLPGIRRRRSPNGAPELPAPWGFVFGEFIPFALRNVEYLDLNGHLPLSQKAVRDLNTLANLISDLAMPSGGSRDTLKKTGSWDDVGGKLASERLPTLSFSHASRAGLESFLPPMRLSVLHYIKTLPGDPRSRTISENIRKPPRDPGIPIVSDVNGGLEFKGDAGIHGESRIAPIVLSPGVCKEIHRVLYRRYFSGGSPGSRGSGLPEAVKEALEVCGNPESTDDPGSDRANRPSSFPGMVASFDVMSPLSTGDDEDGGLPKPPVVALLPNLTLYKIPRIRLPEILQKSGISREVALAIQGLVRVVCAITGLQGSSLEEISKALEGEGRLGESLALRGVMITLHQTLAKAQHHKKEGGIPNLGVPPRPSEGGASSPGGVPPPAGEYPEIPGWVVRKVVGVYRDWMVGVRGVIREIAMTATRVDVEIEFARNQSKEVTCHLSLRRAQEAIRISRGSRDGFRKAIDGIPRPSCNRRLSDVTAGSTGESAGPETPLVTGAEACEIEVGTDDALCCEDCAKRMQELHDIVKEYSEDPTSAISGMSPDIKIAPKTAEDRRASIFRGEYPCGGGDNGEDMIGTYIKDSLIAEAPAIMYQGCPHRSDVLGDVLRRLREEANDLSALQDLLTNLPNNPPASLQTSAPPTPHSPRKVLPEERDGSGESKGGGGV